MTYAQPPDLPYPSTTAWVVAAHLSGAITIEEAARRLEVPLVELITMVAGMSVLEAFLLVTWCRHWIQAYGAQWN